MLLENNLKKYKETPEGFRKLVGLVGLLAIIIFAFIILNNIIIGENKIAESDKIVENEETIISSLPSGRLNFYESSDGYQLSSSEYEAVCKNTKIVAQRAMMGALITNINAQKLYTDNGNKIDKFSVNWDSTSNKCFAQYTIRAIQGTSDTITVSGQAKGFFNTGVDTRVYFIKNF
ncbi:MAG: hypothetical protein HVK41_01600 [Pelagibacteraceae bacterium]|jgi:hypothetical protein|nr:hypothetical protein [Pelagibacteraceae bacterium]MBO6469693.1 hypothetical protein [Pelagibacteraceae bacterium]MBO6479424.1 hypothetical protein [Pelagibacteraceae bacterium]HJL82182.1 hypothetical protein [Gammaproteobacteria bacterium]|tara:strand:+ start:662 stop:1189 length:528 start_codon:yes stop_codon:yes gene_type:complete